MNQSRDGWLPVNFGHAAWQRGWTASLPAGFLQNQRFTQAVTGDGMAFAAGTGDQGSVFAYDAVSGLRLWTKPPEGTVSSGALWYSTPQLGSTKLDGTGFTQRALPGQTSSINHGWAPAAGADGRIYTWTRGLFAEWSHIGTLLRQQLWEEPASAEATDRVAVLSGNFAWLSGPTGLRCFDLNSWREVWSVDGSFQGMPAMSGNQVYVLQEGSLLRFHAHTGRLQSSRLLPGGHYPAQQPVVTNDSVIVASDTQTLILDRSTMNTLTTLPDAGWVSATANRVIITGRTGQLATWYRPHRRASRSQPRRCIRWRRTCCAPLRCPPQMKTPTRSALSSPHCPRQERFFKPRTASLQKRR